MLEKGKSDWLKAILYAALLALLFAKARPMLPVKKFRGARMKKNLFFFILFFCANSLAQADTKNFSVAEIKKQSEDPDVVRARQVRVELWSNASKRTDLILKGIKKSSEVEVLDRADQEIRKRIFDVLALPLQRKNTYAMQIKAGLVRNKQEEMDLYKMCAELGNSSCMESLAIDLLTSGKIDEGIKWMEKGCLAQYDIEEHSACFRVAEEYASKSNQFYDARKAGFWLKKHIKLDANGRFGARRQIIDAGYGNFLK